MVAQEGGTNWYIHEGSPVWDNSFMWLAFIFLIVDCMYKISLFCGVIVNGRYKPILIEKWDPTIDSKMRSKSVHFETSKWYEKRVKKELKIPSESKSTNFPLGIRMHLVAECRDVKGINVINIKKIPNLQAKQTHFVFALQDYPINNIINMNVQHLVLKTSHRHIIMNIKTYDKNQTNLFLGA